MLKKKTTNFGKLFGKGDWRNSVLCLAMEDCSVAMWRMHWNNKIVMAVRQTLRQIIVHHAPLRCIHYCELGAVAGLLARWLEVSVPNHARRATRPAPASTSYFVHTPRAVSF